MATFKQRMAALEDKQKKITEARKTAGDQGGAQGGKSMQSRAFGAPHARRGEDPLTSRGFEFGRMIGAIAAPAMASDRWSNAKVEKDLADKLGKSLAPFSAVPFVNGHDAILAPLGSDFMPPEVRDTSLINECKSLVTAGIRGFDPDEVRWLHGKSYQGQGKAAQSWLDQTLMGSLVGPAERGELIDLLRNQEALSQLGCRQIPMPMSGSIQFARQTAASTGYWVGENNTTGGATQSQVKTGALTLRSKQCVALVAMPNQLIRHGGPAAEALIRMDMTKTLSLTMDLALLQGAGGDTSPAGILGAPGVETVTPGGTNTNGYTFAPGNVYDFEAKIAENNGKMNGYLMRPTMFAGLKKQRADSITAGDGAGPFLFNITRDVGEAIPDKLNGYPVLTTPQVSNARVRGSGTNLTYIMAADWTDYILALFGAIEFAAATQGDTAFAQDQTLVRAILIGDGGMRHPGVFAVADYLLVP